MKFSFFKNDKSTAKDEYLLLAFILLFMAIGIALIVLKPTFWIIDQIYTVSFGLIMLITGVMFIPGLIYRFLENDKKKGR